MTLGNTSHARRIEAEHEVRSLHADIKLDYVFSGLYLPFIALLTAMGIGYDSTSTLVVAVVGDIAYSLMLYLVIKDFIKKRQKIQDLFVDLL